jgi:hypothetical protein
MISIFTKILARDIRRYLDRETELEGDRVSQHGALSVLVRMSQLSNCQALNLLDSTTHKAN